MRVVYFFAVNVALPSGKNRATRQKIEALKKTNEQIEAFTLDCSIFSSKILAKADISFRLIRYILLNRKKIDIYMSRGSSPILAHFICKCFGIHVVREIHADIFDEIPHLNKAALTKFLIRLLSLRPYFLDIRADRRIYNNPILRSYHISKGVGKKSDRSVYNGSSMDAVVNISREEAREKFGMRSGFKYLVFTGSASVWHGIHYLVKLQKRFLEYGDNVRIVCGGGEVACKIDPDGWLINITPLNDVECCELIKAADACLLPVNNVRVSPGSPLKLYDYMINGAPVISQKCTRGYSDEVEKFGAGISVDFLDVDMARQDILRFLEDDEMMRLCSLTAADNAPCYVWERRVSEWFCGPEARNSHLDKDES